MTRVGIFGHYGNANLGDEAITQAAIESVRRHIPGAEIACFSINPADSSARHGVPAFPIRHFSQPWPAYPLDGEPELAEGTLGKAPPPPPPEPPPGLVTRIKRWPPVRAPYDALRATLRGLRALPTELAFLWRSRRVLRDFDLLMVTGSNQFLDNFGGLWGFPYTVLKWVVLARLTGTRVALVSLGAGPLDGRWSKRFCRWSLRLAHHASYRDDPSRELVEGPTGPYKGHVFPDVASNIDLPPAPPAPEGQGLLVGINPMPVFDARYWHASDEDKYREYVEKLCVIVRHVLARGHRPVLFSTQVKDNAVIADVMGLLDDETGKRVTVRQPRRVDDLLVLLQQLDLAIPTRFHGNVLALRSGTPAIGICYYRKIGDLLTEMGLGQYQVPIDGFRAEKVCELFDAMAGELDDARAKVAVKAREYIDACDAQYEMIAALVARDPG